MARYFFTFACNDPLAQRYYLADADGFSAAREEICAIRGPRWAFQYPERDLARQVRDWRLTPVTAAELKEINAIEARVEEMLK